MLACIAPWSLRNTRVFGEFVLISTNGGTCTWLGKDAQVVAATDATWRVNKNSVVGWHQQPGVDSSWPTARVLAPYGQGAPDWLGLTWDGEVVHQFRVAAHVGRPAAASPARTTATASRTARR